MVSHAGTCFDTDPKRNQGYDAAGRATKSPFQSTPAIFDCLRRRLNGTQEKACCLGMTPFLT